MKFILKPPMAAAAVFAMLAVGYGEEETTKVVEDDTATSQGSEEPLPDPREIDRQRAVSGPDDDAE